MGSGGVQGTKHNTCEVFGNQAMPRQGQIGQ